MRQEETDGMRGFQPFLIGTLILESALAIGCAEHRHRTYDPYYNDYHTWNSGEDVYYRQWLGERHYNYVEYNRLDKARQKEYWEWRHKHNDHDRDRDHDRDHDRDRH